nr:tetratricopeptide repeat protein [Phycisphaerae bacterium]
MFGRNSKSDSSRQTSREISQYTHGMLRYRRGDYQAASELLSSLGDHPGPLGRMAVYYGAMSDRALGLEAMRTSDFSKAERHLRAAARAIGPRANLTKYLVACYARNQKFDKCAAVMEKKAQTEGGPDQWRKIAQAQWRGGRKSQAFMSLHQAIRTFGDDPRLQLQLGLFYAAEESFDEAFAHLSNAAQDDCDNALIHYYLGLTATAQGDFAQALRCFQRSFDLEPDNLLVARQLSLAANALDQAGARFILRLPEQPSQEESTPARQLAGYVTRDSSLPEAMLNLPVSEMDNDLFGVLAGVLAIAIKEHDKYADLHYYASRTHDRLGDIERASSHAMAAIDINPRYVKARM